MITLNKNYYITADNNGYALIRKVTRERKEDNQSKGYKKGEPYQDTETVGYSATLYGMLSIYLECRIKDHVQENDNNIKEMMKVLKGIKQSVNELNKIANENNPSKA